MSNASKFVAVAVAVRAAGSKHPQTGITYGGVYYPEHVIDGRKVTARFEMNAYINGMNYTDPETGIVKEGRNEVVRIVAWNGQNAKPGGGLADLCAKAVTVGKEFSCELDIRTFKKRLFIADRPQTDHLGQEIMVNGVNFVMKGLPIWGNDADSVIQSEINNYRQTGQATFSARPPFWNVPGHADAAIWDAIKKTRKAAQYVPGSATFGHARVVLPAGAQALAVGGTPDLSNPAALMAMLQQLMAGAQPKPEPVVAPTPVAPATPGVDPTMLATLLAQLQGGAATGTQPLPNVPPVTGAAGTVLAGGGNMPI